MQNDIAKLLLRLGFGGMMLTHGYPKMMKILRGDYSFGNPIGVGEEASLVLTVFSEVICAFLIVIGFKTKWAAIPLVITMIVAAFIVHGSDPLVEKEKAILHGIGFLAIYLLGAGKYSIDKK